MEFNHDWDNRPLLAPSLVALFNAVVDGLEAGTLVYEEDHKGILTVELARRICERRRRGAEDEHSC